MKSGLRVVRGPNWKYGNDDGGEGHLGTVIDFNPGTVTVLWDSGLKKNYRAGHENAYDLHVFDNAQICVNHSSVKCDECQQDGIKGLRWKCSVCHNFDLCSSCYHNDKHDLSHSFLRFDTNSDKSCKLPPRTGIEKYQAVGIFKSATVTRGLHWSWNNQDGGEGNHGFVVDIKDWGPSFRSQADVLWANGKGYTYRLGHDGKVDLKYVKAASGGSYYKSHLPVLGKMEIQVSDLLSTLTHALIQQELLKPLFDFQEIITSLQEAANQDAVAIKAGIRVVRGSDWSWANQDGGEGFVGTVTDIGSSEPNKPPEKCVTVTWDNGSKNTYRIGRGNSYDLLVLDNAPSGVKHKNYECNECKAKPIPGIRWKCASCFSVHLCSRCYHSNKHETSHSFWRYDHSTNKRFKVSCRRTSQQRESKGIFTTAIVSRGPDWKWADQDAGDVTNGLVLDIKSWDASERSNDAAEVLWANENQNTYRLGYDGKVDLKFVTAASGGHYYKDHLPLLGKVEKSPCMFQVGDIVRCCFDVDLVKQLQDNHGGWIDDMAEYIHLDGKVVQIDKDDDVVVQYDDGKKWFYNQDALSKVDSMTRCTQNPMDSDIVRQVIGLGFERREVQDVVFKHFNEGKGLFTSVQTLVEKVLDSQQASSPVEETSHRAVSENQRIEEISESIRSPSLVMSGQPSPPSVNQRLAEENRMLREQRQCKVCMDSEACVTFVPCGHLISCENCYRGLTICPMCRKNIDSVLRTYLS